MGLDTIELVMRCEEVFRVDLPDSDREQVNTVGDLYHLICRHLGFRGIEQPGPETGTSKLRPQAVMNLHRIEWNAEDVWATLVAIFVGQLQVQPAEVT